MKDIQYDFSEALKSAKAGKRVARAGWNGKGMWIAIGGTPVTLEADKFWNAHAKQHALDNGGTAIVEGYFIMKTASGSIQMGWGPSQSDLLATDWVVID